MFDRLATLAHGLRVLVEALLYGLQYMLMLPAGDAPLRTGLAALLKRRVSKNGDAASTKASTRFWEAISKAASISPSVPARKISAWRLMIAAAC